MTSQVPTYLRSSMARSGWNIDTAMEADKLHPMPLGPVVFQATTHCGDGFYKDQNGRSVEIVQMAGIYFGQEVRLYASNRQKDALDNLSHCRDLFAKVDARSLGYITRREGPSIQCFFVPDDGSIGMM